MTVYAHIAKNNKNHHCYCSKALESILGNITSLNAARWSFGVVSRSTLEQSLLMPLLQNVIASECAKLHTRRYSQYKSENRTM